MTANLAPYVDLHDLLPSQTKLRRFAPGETLLGPGDQPNAIWLIRSGSVRSLVTLPPQNQWRTVQRHGCGELIG